MDIWLVTGTFCASDWWCNFEIMKWNMCRRQHSLRQLDSIWWAKYANIQTISCIIHESKIHLISVSHAICITDVDITRMSKCSHALRSLICTNSSLALVLFKKCFNFCSDYIKKLPLAHSFKQMTLKRISLFRKSLNTHMHTQCFPSSFTNL